MAHDGLVNAYDGRPWACSPRPRGQVRFSREEQDAYAIESVKRAQAAQAAGAFADEIVRSRCHPQGRRRACDRRTARQVRHRQDPDPAPGLQEGRQRHRRQFLQHSDGAAAVVLLSADEAGRRGLPLARIVAHATHSQEPEWFTTAPIGAIRNVLDKAGWSGPTSTCSRSTKPLPWWRWRRSASWASPRQAQRQRRCLRIGPPDRCLRRAPGGDPGQRFAQRGGKRGIASLCIGGGEATACHRIDLKDL
jgi:acetyl-CoA C-acetyltransferase